MFFAGLSAALYHRLGRQKAALPRETKPIPIQRQIPPPSKKEEKLFISEVFSEGGAFWAEKLKIEMGCKQNSSSPSNVVKLVN